MKKPTATEKSSLEPCYFCDVVARGEQRVHVAFENGSLMAVMATAPINPGQLLLFAKAHVATLAEMGEDTVGHLFETATRLVVAIRESGIRCEGTELYASEGPVTFLTHVVVQLLPRFEGDPLWRKAMRSWRLGYDTTREPFWWEEWAERLQRHPWLPNREASDDELARVAAGIREAYHSIWGATHRHG